MFGAAKKCAKCEKQVYPIEELKCLDKVRVQIIFFGLKVKLNNFLKAMAQKLLQMYNMQFVAKHEKLQRF